MLKRIKKMIGILPAVLAAAVLLFLSPMTVKAYDEESIVYGDGCYFNKTTGTLTLKGEVRKSDSIPFEIVLPDGVGKGDVLKINVVEEGATLPKDSSKLFKDFNHATEIDLKGADTSEVTDMSCMFEGCSSLQSLDLSGFDTGNVTVMRDMFSDCDSLQSLDLSGFDTGNVTVMSDMFSDSYSLQSLDLSGFDTSQVSDMNGMFSGCDSLQSLDLSGFDTGKVENMENMFTSCLSLPSLDLSGFVTSKVSIMGGMFSNCKSLNTLDLSGFDTGQVVNMLKMFLGMDNLSCIYVGKKWSTENVEFFYEMFKDCPKLKGGAGTAYDSSHTGLEYARIDGRDGEKGYLTAPYSVIIEAGEHVTVTADKVSNLLDGDSVTLTVKPDTGYLLESFTVKDKTGSEISVTDGQFEMPESDVTVSATASLVSMAFEQDGDEYTIKTLRGWEIFCRLIEEGETFAGKTVKLGADIGTAEAPVTSMAGTSAHPFGGTFDGRGHSLTFTWEELGSYAAPFRYVEGTEASHAVIENLNVVSTLPNPKTWYPAGLIAKQSGFADVRASNVEVKIGSEGSANESNYSGGLVSWSAGPLTVTGCTVTGEIFTNGKYASGLIGNTDSGEQGSTSISNCLCSVSIKSKKEGDGTHGGLVGFNVYALTIEGCAFDGEILSETTKCCGGFVGWTQRTIEIRDSVFAPKAIDLAEEVSETVPSGTFLRTSKSISATVANSYYFTPLGTLQGMAARAVIAGPDVTLTPAGEAAVYDVSKITVYKNNSGLLYGKTYYAGEDENVTLTLQHTDKPEDEYGVFKGFSANAGTLSESGDTYILTMPDEDVIVSADYAYADGMGARLAGHSVSLDGDIGVSFYMELSPKAAGSETAYMQFTIPAGGKTEIQKVAVRDATQIGGYYVFKCKVAAKEMASKIKAQMFDPAGGKEGTEYTYSVKEYADYLLAHADPEGNDQEKAFAKAAPLVKAMLNYGAFAQIYFDQNPEELANESLTAEDKVLGEVVLTPPQAAFSLPEGVAFEGATLSLKSETTLSLYFRSYEELTFSCAGKTVEKTANDTFQVARIRGIAAAELTDSFTLNIKAENANGTVTYSPMNYCGQVLAKAPAAQNENLQNVVRALCLYANAASQYFN